MKIVLVNHYAVPTRFYPLARPALFAKKLKELGHDVVIVAASSIHNSKSQNLIDSKDSVKEFVDDGITYLLVKCLSYEGNGFRRVRNILQFANRLPKALARLENIDAIIATSFDPLSCKKGIEYAKKHGIKAIAEIADLWPETLVDYCNLSAKNPIVKYLRNVEKKIYLKSDSIIFTMEGAYNYIVEQKWEKIIPRNKTFYINNGIDLEQFNYNRNNYIIEDNDLNDAKIFKVVYTGSIRKVNNLGNLLDVAKLIENDKIKFLIWGDGDELDYLKERVHNEKIKNVIFKGRVDKKYIPYITSQANLNFAHNGQSRMFNYGISFNKIFDYLAAGKPILCDFDSKYNPVIQYEAGVEVKTALPKDIASQIELFSKMPNDKYELYCKNAIKAAENFDFKVLTEKLMKVIKNI